MTSSIDHFSKSMREPISLTSRQFRHRAITNAEYRAYAAVSCDVSDQEDCLSGEFPKTGSSPAGGSIRRLICLRSAAGADSPPPLSPSAFRHPVVTLHALDPSARRPHGYHQQAKQIPLTGVRFSSPAPSPAPVRCRHKSGALVGITPLGCRHNLTSEYSMTHGGQTAHCPLDLRSTHDFVRTLTSAAVPTGSSVHAHGRSHWELSGTWNPKKT
jgi:hypothetical protein